jgi:hypothetical protein
MKTKIELLVECRAKIDEVKRETHYEYPREPRVSVAEKMLDLWEAHPLFVEFAAELLGVSPE